MSYEITLLTVAVPVGIAIAAITVLSLRRRMPRTGTLTRFESYAASLIGAGAMLTALFGVFGLVASVGRAFGENPLFVDGMPYSGSPVERLADSAAIASSGYESVWLRVSDAPTTPRWLFLAEWSLPSIATIAISVAVAWLSFAVIRERPFVRTLPHVIGVAAIAVMVAGIGAQAAGAFGRAALVEYLGVRQVTTVSGEQDEALTYFALGLDLSPIGWALGLALVAAAFQIGIRMQKDTEALV